MKSKSQQTIFVFVDNKGNRQERKYFVPQTKGKDLPIPEIGPNFSFEQMSFEQIQTIGSINDKAAEYVWVKTGLRSPSLSKGKSLLAHQYKTIEWMHKAEKQFHFGISGGIVSLQMGLGKSLVAIFLALSAKKGEWPTLIVCSKTLATSHWPEEFKKFFGGEGASPIRVLVLTKDNLGKQIDDVTPELIKLYDFVITTYDTCQSACKKGKYFDFVRTYGESGLHMGKVIQRMQRDISTIPKNTKARGDALLYEIPWERIIADESQRFCNPTATTFEAMISLYGTYKWCLTGTMLRNYEKDIWSQLFFCGYIGVMRPDEWSKRYKRIMFLHSLNERLFIMDYKEAGIAMPLLIENKIKMNFSPNELLIYKAILERARDILADILMNRLNFSHLFAIFTALRKSCLSSFLSITKAGVLGGKIKSKQEIGMWVQDEGGTAGLYNTKTNRLVDIIKSIPRNEKVLVFSLFHPISK